MPPWFQLPEPHEGLLASDRYARVAVVGAGLAGCWLARQLATRGVDVTLFEAAGTIAAGPSGNSVAIVKPYVMRQPSRIEDFYQRAFRFLQSRLHNDSALADVSPLHAIGVLQLVQKAYTARQGFTSVNAAENCVLRCLTLRILRHNYILPLNNLLAPIRYGD